MSQKSITFAQIIGFNKIMEHLINNAFFRTTLRSSGYNTIQAIADVVDNSLEKKVNSTEVHVFIEIDSSDKIIGISVVDNGNGMDLPTMTQCVTLGSQTGKDEDTLGKYGIGSKSASLSYAQSLRILSKPESGLRRDKLVIGVLDVTLPKGSYDLNAPIVQKADLAYYNVTGGNKTVISRLFGSFKHGTWVNTFNIDRCTIQDPYKLFEQLVIELGMIYHNDLTINNIGMFVHLVRDGETIMESPVVAIDWTGESFGASELIGSGVIGETGLKYKAYYVNDDITLKKKDIHKNRYVGRSSKYRGLFFVRNGRLLTDYGVDFDFITEGGNIASIASQGYNCFRCIIEMTGEQDSLIGVSYTKIINGFGGMTQVMKDAIAETLSPLVIKAKDMDEEKKVAFRMSDEGAKQMLKTLAALNKLLGSCRSFIDKLKGLAIKRHLKLTTGAGDEPGYFNNEEEENKNTHHHSGSDTNNTDKNGDLNGGGEGNNRKSNNASGGLLEHIYEVNKGEKEPYVTFPRFGVVEINRDHKKYKYLMAVCGEGERQRELINIACGMYARKLVEQETGKPLDDIFEMYDSNLNNIEGKCLEVVKPYSDKKK